MKPLKTLLANTPPCGPPGKAAILTPWHHLAVGSVASADVAATHAASAIPASLAPLAVKYDILILPVLVLAFGRPFKARLTEPGAENLEEAAPA